MTWENNLLPASFRGVEFDILSIDDDAQRALARHAYPYTDGVDIEDMGREGRHVSVRAIFYGDDYEQRLQEFIAALDERGAGDLVHPVFGAMDQMQVNSYRISHQAEMPDSCAVNIEFEESVTGAPFFDRTLASQKADAIDVAADEAEDASNTVVEDECNALTANSDSISLSRISAMRQQAVTFLMTLNNEVHGVITSITDPIRNVLGFVADVTALTQSLVDIVPNELEYLQNFANANFNRIDRLLSPASLTPFFSRTSSVPDSYSAWLSSVTNMNATQATASPVSSYPVSAAQSLADTQILATHIAVECAVTKSRILSQVLASEADTPTLTPPQIEQLVNNVRASINAAMLQARTRYNLEQSRAITEPLKNLAFNIQESARSIINAKPPMIMKSAESALPLRVLAHRWYGDHTRALELQRLNNLRQPNQINAGDQLNAYAK